MTGLCAPVLGQEASVPPEAPYSWPEDPAVREKLDRWQDLKFGVIFHFGLYSAAGIVESWTLCREDWIRRPEGKTYQEYKAWYWSLAERFDPRAFDPDPWAEAARDAGMRYVVFTTKHHDGFCLFDTHQTEFKITSGPFSDHPRADITRHVFEAFRRRGFMIGAYFSKPDWHCQDYWWNERPTPDRNVNYDIREHPDRWRRYQDFTSRQIGELMTGYGLIDILWLDGGWVRPKNTLTEEVLSWGAPIPDFDQSIDLPGIAARARTEQPGLLIVDRTVHGELENYRTPERRIPEDPLPYPWESCLPLGNNWGFVPGDPLKSPTTVIHSLIEIVAKGGSLLLGIGPRPDGTLDDEALTILADMGGWMKRNGEAIYETRSTSPYRDGETFFTRGKDGTRYALVRIPEGAPLPSLITWKRSPPETGSSMVILGEERDVLWRQEGDTTLVTLPAAVQGSASPALVLRFSPAE